MLGLIWDGMRLAHSRGVELRTPRGDDVVVEISVAGLCHSDLKPMDGDIPQALPVILGHEAVGRVVDRGPDATLEVGTRVVMTVIRPCGSCDQCVRGRRIRCRATALAAPTPFSLDGEPVQQFVRLGAFARRTIVAQSQAIPIAEGLSDEVAAMISCATVTAFGAVEERARVAQGDTVLILGAGGIGLNAVIAARAAGASRIVVCDVNPRKEEVARRCGATDFVLTDSTPASRLVLELEPKGFDVVLECVGRVELLEQAVASLGWGGRVVIVGLPAHGSVMPLEVRDLFNDKSILGCRMGSVDPWVALPRLVDRHIAGEFDLEPLVTRTVPATDAEELVAALRSGELDRGFLDFREEDPR